MDAVELAIKVLEDKEITNAGYGSNLALDGTVECDATVIDHYGRSGAVGAVSRKSIQRSIFFGYLLIMRCDWILELRNPIHLARIILDCSTKPLSLRRVPPNLLVGPGATDFAHSMGLPVLPHDFLVSRSAHERWKKWVDDLRRAEKKELGAGRASEDNSDTLENRTENELPRHLAAVWNESQPFSPRPSANASPVASDNILPHGKARTLKVTGMLRFSNPKMATSAETPPSKRLYADAANTPTTDSDHWKINQQGNDGQFPQTCSETDVSMFIDNDPPKTTLHARPLVVGQPDQKLGSRDEGSSEPSPISLPNSLLGIQTNVKGDEDRASEAKILQAQDARSVLVPDLREDCIRDTVGAIAVDCLGNIAAASSSGGIGMKHRGRVGPAALVGIGTAVIPVDSEDPQKTSVATVTSGTGEHMATTMAASTCASRLYTLTRKSKHGGSEATDEDSAIKAFVERDFMGKSARRLYIKSDTDVTAY